MFCGAHGHARALVPINRRTVIPNEMKLSLRCAHEFFPNKCYMDDTIDDTRALDGEIPRETKMKREKKVRNIRNNDAQFSHNNSC